MDREIVDFISANKVATICCTDNNVPHCFNCYYSFLEQEGLLIYKSSLGTKHEEILRRHKVVAGTIIPEQLEVAVIKGIQYEGVLVDDALDLTIKMSAAYYLKFPFAMAVPGKVYGIKMNAIKFTDNTRGFGYKQQWERPD